RRRTRRTRIRAASATACTSRRCCACSTANRPATPTEGMVRMNSTSDDLGKLLLRLTLGLLMLLHGIAKIIGGPAHILGLVSKIGLPPALGYFVFVGEVLAPLLVIIGLWTRPAALVIAINMVVA